MVRLLVVFRLFRSILIWFEVWFRGLSWKLQKIASQGCFGSSFPKTPSSQFSEMNFRNISEVQIFFVFYFFSHINRFQLFTGTCLLEMVLREERILQRKR